MTAATTKDIVDQFTLLNGIQLDTSLNVFWQCGQMMYDVSSIDKSDCGIYDQCYGKIQGMSCKFVGGK
jgi:hypothetical protein